jgi:DNA-binding CsgD family transcriptional regulator
MLHGRVVEQARIEELLEGARASRSGVLVLLGEPGIGKSTLLEHAARRADGMRVLRCVGLEAESELAFAGLYQLLRPALDTLPTLPPAQAAALRGAFGLADGPVDARFLISVAVLGLLSEAGGDDGLVCLVDDAQWMDEPTIDALVFAARRLDADPVALLIAARTGGVRELAPTGLPELEVGPLEPAAASALLTERASAPISAAVAEQLLAESQGNPLALVELPAALTPSQLAGHAAVPSPLPAGARVEHAFLARARALGNRAQGFLLLAAADDTGDLATVLAAAEQFGLGAAECDAAERAGLISLDEGQLACRHPLVRSAVYRAATFSSRRAVHRAFALALGGHPDRRAWHVAAAALGPDETAAEALERSASEAALRSGHATAAAALERAAELSGDEESRGRRLIAAADASWYAGHHDRVTGLLDRAEPSVSAAELRARIAYLRGARELESGAPNQGYELLVAAASRVLEEDRALGLTLLVRAAFAGRVEWSGQLRRLAADVSPRDDPERLMAAVVTGTSCVLMGEFDSAGPALSEACRLASTVDGPRLVTTAASAAAYRADAELGEALYGRAVADARAVGALGILPVALNGLGIMQSLLGRLTAAAASATEGLALARQTGQENIACYQLALAARVAALQGRDDDCRALASEALASARARGLRMQAGMATWALAELDLGQGRPESALARLLTIAHDPAIAHPGVELYSLPHRLEAAVRAGEIGLATQALDRFGRWAEACGSSWGLPQLARMQALVAPDEGVEAQFEEALARHALGGGAFERARTQLAFGEWLRRQRRRVDARTQLRSALDSLDTAGAELWAHRARAELRASGESARKREPSTIDLLTSQELQVAELVATGATNREVATQLFLSPRTIDFHLRNVFRKLGVTSRHQLGGALTPEEPERDPATTTGDVAGSTRSGRP